MRRACRRIGVVVFACAAAAGCGGGGTPEPLGQFESQFVAAFCQRVLACCSSAEFAAVGLQIVDQASCETAFAPGPQSALGSGPGLVDAGLATYNGDAARACLDAVAALPCGMWRSPLMPPNVPQCDGVFVGTLPAGSACTSSPECASDFCTNDSSGGISCAAPVGLAQSCEFAPCVAGLHCVSPPGGGGPSTCQAQTFALGSPCFSDQDCTSDICTADTTNPSVSHCAQGMSCGGP
jgi:hypothetical protein